MPLLKHLGQAPVGEQIVDVRRIGHGSRLMRPSPNRFAQNPGHLNESRAESVEFVHLARREYPFLDDT